MNGAQPPSCTACSRSHPREANSRWRLGRTVLAPWPDAARARDDARSLAAAGVQVHSAKEHVDAQTRGRALTCLVVAGVEARQAWLADRSHGRPDLDSAINDATLQR